ncbi:hypothetical protein CGCSCA5_v012386 [Colletotrichum siamense]|nr:hypothetical protein CGCSCA5_v012386 [Colletotrichum siamense]
MLWACLQMPAIDEDDMQHIAGNTVLILHEDRGKAHQLLTARLFRNWMGRVGSAKLLVHGDFQPPYNITPFSAICTLLGQSFRNPKNGYISLVFFCGRHLVWDEYQGGSAMIRSLISQLLCQAVFSPFPPHPKHSLRDIEEHGLGTLCDIFCWLLEKLPSTVHVFCMIDGISLYEDRFLDGMDTVIMQLVSMAQGSGGQGFPDFKLLITSPRPTLEVRKAFNSGDSEILHMQSFPAVGEPMGVLGLREQIHSDMYLDRTRN